MTRHEQDGHFIQVPDWRGADHAWTQEMNDDGSPNFKAINPVKVFQCINEGRCGVCGLKLRSPRWCWIVDSDADKARDRPVPFTVNEVKLLLREAPMHLFCARLAGRLCPALRSHRYGVPGIFTSEPVDGKQVAIIVLPRDGSPLDHPAPDFRHLPLLVTAFEVIPKRS